MDRAEIQSYSSSLSSRVSHSRRGRKRFPGPEEGSLKHKTSTVRKTPSSPQDSPCFDVGDDLLDLVADLVDGLVIGLVVWVERQVRGFSLGGDHSQSDVSLVADVLRWWGSVRDVKQAAAAQSLSVVRASVLGVRRPRPGSLRGCRRPGRSDLWSCACLKSSSG